MKRIKPGLLLLMMGALLLSGCIYSHREALTPTGRTVIVREEPPLPRQSPAPRHVLTPGYWAYTGNHWAWVPEHWE